MSEAITRVTLFVPGGALLRAVHLDCPTDWIENDGHFGQAFSFGTVEPAKVETIDKALGALVLLWPVDLKTGREQIVAAVKQLREAGALAVRIEESKLGWDIDTWIEIFESDDPVAWHRGAVAFLGTENALQSIGMHVFSLPDVRIPLDGDRRELQTLATILDIYQLAEDPLLQSGQTFAPDSESPKRVVERWPAVEYPRDHPCHNPYGTWRIGPPGGKARATGELAFAFTPPLIALLGAAEERAGAPLTQQQVETIRDQAVCISLKVADVQKLERGRGYADLDPELAWPQWQLVRSADS
jgi:hypothetical protein